MIADLHSAASSLVLRMVQQTTFEAAFAQKIGSRVVAGAQIQYDGASYWTNSAVSLRLLTRVHPTVPSIPREVVTIEAGTLAAKDQSLAAPKPGDNWTQFETFTKQVSFFFLCIFY